MKNLVVLTEALVVSLVIFLVVYDLIALWLGGWDATISVVVLTWSSRYPILPFLFGVVCGHLFWPQRVDK